MWTQSMRVLEQQQTCLFVWHQIGCCVFFEDQEVGLPSGGGVLVCSSGNNILMLLSCGA
jgi:hypothetical protein